MSRVSLKTFLDQAKHELKTSLQEQKPAAFVIGNESADLDSITSALVYAYLQSNSASAQKTTKRFWIPVANIPAADLRLRPELTATLKHAELQPSDLITLDDLSAIEELPPKSTSWVLVDHNAFRGRLGKRFAARVVGVIDHHVDEKRVPDGVDPRIIEKTGSCCSHVVNYCRAVWDARAESHSRAPSNDNSDSDAQLAKLGLAPILIDTVDLQAKEKVTQHDRQAVAYLENKIQTSERSDTKFDREAFYSDINKAKSNLDDLSLDEILRKDYKHWEDECSPAIGISSCVRSIEYLESKAQGFVPALAEFAKKQGVPLFALMTADNDTGQFQRELLLLVTEGENATSVARKFIADCSHDLELQEREDAGLAQDHQLPFLCSWRQGNLSASRKRIAPMLRAAAKGERNVAQPAL